MADIKYLDKIQSPQDLKEMTKETLPSLAEEIREFMINTVSKTGGHLASNLGVVELTIALHRCFDSPDDKIVWDVGHQCYPHKLLTGRYDKFSTLRQKDGLSGFLRPTESEHDIFYSGHSSTSISSALGIAAANKIFEKQNYTVAVIGDGSFTGGLVYEALNNAGRTKDKLIVVLNDNEMSISHNVGAVARYLAVTRSKKRYVRMKARLERLLEKIPFIGKSLAMNIYKLKRNIKNLIYKSTMFEDMGFRYMGPIDGHNIEQLTDALEAAKTVASPVLLHVITVKGKGYDYAEQHPDKFHGVSNFDIDTGEFNPCSATFCEKFGEHMCKTAENDKSICLITAAMALGTGLGEFSKRFSSRFFDVGIAEEHAVTFASGLAKGGMIPVFAVYSTFLQRCYDQIIHDAALQNQKLVFAIDRAGFVGEDGETHNGLFDVAFLNSVPDITVYSPATYEEMSMDFEAAIYKDKNVAAVRYPKGSERNIPEDYIPSFGTFDIYGHQWAGTIIVTYGRIFGEACLAVKALTQYNIKSQVLKLNRIKPIDPSAIEILLKANNIFFVEEGIRSGGIGEKLGSILLENGFRGKYEITAVNDCFVKQSTVNQLIKEYKLDSESIVKNILSALRGSEDE